MEEQSHKGARIPIRRETQAKNGHAVEKRDNAVERGGKEENRKENPGAESAAGAERSAAGYPWNKTTTRPPGEQGIENARARPETTETISKQARRDAADCAGDFQSRKWLNSARYIWQPGTRYKTSGKTDQWLSQRPSVGGDGRANRDKTMT